MRRPAVVNAPPIPYLTTLDIFHDCSRIAWFWAATGMANVEEVRGMDLLYTTADGSKVNMAMVEFNSLAWAKSVGWECTKPDGTSF